MQVFKITPQIKTEKSSRIDDSGKRYQRFVWKCKLPNGKQITCFSKNKKNIPEDIKKAISSSKEYEIALNNNSLIDFKILFPEPINIDFDSAFINDVEENPSEENPSEENPSEENPSEENPSEENPSEENPSEENSSEENPSEKNSEIQLESTKDPLIDDLENISKQIQLRFESKPTQTTESFIEEDEEVIIALSKEEIKKNAYKIISALSENNSDYISSIYNGSGFDINISNSGGITTELDIKPDSAFNIKALAALKKRKKAIFKIDSIDGELAFVEFINVLLAKIGFGTRVKLDNEYYEDMGDSGDIRIGSKRIDVKTRQALGRKCNLLINEETLSKDLNYFVYIIREGDVNKEGSRRRLNIKGYVTQEQAKNGKQIEIKKHGTNKSSLKREFESHEILPLNGLICDIILSLLKKELV